jgi:hypothetical protein
MGLPGRVATRTINIGGTVQRIIRCGLSAAISILGLAGCEDSQAPTPPPTPSGPTMSVAPSENGRHIVLFAGDDAPADFEARVSALGGTTEQVLTGAGLAVVSGLTDAAAADLASVPGVRDVTGDRVVSVGSPNDPEDPDDSEAPPTPAEALSDAEPDPLTPCRASTARPTKARYFRRQWNLCAIKAYAAWDAGFLGSSDVSVFILDTGIDYLRPDLLGRVDLSRSKSLVPASSTDEDERARNAGMHEVMDFHSHGTAVAALIASNADSLAGVTRNSTLVSVKALDRNRRGAVSVFIQSIYYAANNGADVIHFSFAFEGFAKHDSTGGGAALVGAFNRAITYAHRRGAVMVAAAGNLARDYDHDQDWWSPCTAPHVICVSATGPTLADAVDGPWPAGFDSVASYTNFGRSAISVAGPGSTLSPGNVPLNTGKSVWLTCSRETLVAGNPRFCRTGARRWESTGTSFGAAVTSGLAALLVSKVGDGCPAVIRAVIEESADDLGQPGTDPYYGKGRINVERAISTHRRC